MSAFFALIFKLIPLYTLIFLGFLADRFLKVKKEAISPLLIYLISPLVVFQGIVSRDFTASILLIPVIFLLIALIISLTYFVIFKKSWEDATPNVLSFSVGACNAGYFGLPIILMLFGHEALQVAVMAIFSVQFFEITFGFYIMARGNFSSKASFMKLIKLPTIYAFALGLILNACGYRAEGSIQDFFNLFKGAYSVLGMMLIGLALSSVKRQTFDFKFLTLAMIGKFILWPICIISFIFLDQHFFHLYDIFTYKIMMILSAVPIAANTVAFATQLETRPDKAAAVVVLSTLIALVFLPMMVGLVLQF